MRSARGVARYVNSGDEFSGAKLSKPSSGFWKIAAVGPESVMRVRARGSTVLAVTPYFCISAAVPVISDTMPALAAE